MSNLVLGAASFLMQQEEVPKGVFAAMGVVGIVVLLLAVFFIAVGWKIFTKAGEPGWASLIPIYNTIVWCKICGKPWWWIFILWLVIPPIIMTFELAKRFGKGAGFGLGLLLVPVIFYPVLAFGSARYQG